MHKLILILTIALMPVLCIAQWPQHVVLKDGDLIFQDLDCGPLCDAIEQVTVSARGRHFSHIGLVCRDGDSVFVLEAIGKAVRITSLEQFTNRTTNPMLIGRVKSKYKGLVRPAITFARQQIGVPYDDAFIYDNGKYYCSELIYDAFRQANHGKDFFVLQPMTFRQPGSTAFFPAWISYYEKLGVAIPEAAPGINPGGISTSDKIDILEP